MNQFRWAIQTIYRQPVVMKILRLVHGHVLGFMQYVTIIFGSASHHMPPPPSQHCAATCRAIFRLIAMRARKYDTKVSSSHSNDTEGVSLELSITEDFVTEQSQWEQVRKLLQECGELDSLVQVTNNDGYNILLMAVLSEDVMLLDLLHTEGFDIGQVKCTGALHLACRLGSLNMVQFLLSRCVSTEQEAGMCYPNNHCPIRHVPSRFHFLETDVFSCDSNHMLPIMYAIEQDHVHVVQFLLENKDPFRKKWPFQHNLLHYASKTGAYLCMQYLLNLRPDEVNTVDTAGMVPLHHAVPWGKRYAKLLVEAGANVHSLTHRKQGILHIFYTLVKNPLGIFQTSKFLLGTGMEQDVNRQDENGNSVLHLLISLVNRKAHLFPEINIDSNSSHKLQEECNQQVLQTLELLLAFNCDPNLKNNDEVTVLQKHILLNDFLLNNDLSDASLASLPDRAQFKLDFVIGNQVLEILLKHGADPNILTPSGSPCHLLVLQMLLKLDESRLQDRGENVRRYLEMICRHGANASLTASSHFSTVAILVRICLRALNFHDEEHKNQMSLLVKEVLALLLRHGFNPNHCIKQKLPKQDTLCGNILVEVVKLAQYVRKPQDLQHVHSWLLTLLQHGADPDLEPYPTDPIICHSQSSIFLKPKSSQPVNQYIYEVQDINQILDGGFAWEILLLFYNSMDHVALYQCLSTARFLSRFDPNSAPSGTFLKLINNLFSQPRSLQQIARVAIYKSMNRDLKASYQLPLPKSLQDYLVDIK